MYTYSLVGSMVSLSLSLSLSLRYISFTNHFIIMVVQNWVSGFNVLLGVCVSVTFLTH